MSDITTGPLALKLCLQCKEEKPISEFHKSGHKSGKAIVRPRCKLCINANNRHYWPFYYTKSRLIISQRRKQRWLVSRKHELKKRYGLTPEQFEAMLQAQHGVCAICQQPDQKRTLCVDHNHTTGKIRSLLCGNCNLSIGTLREDPKLARAVANYLEYWEASIAAIRA